MATSALNLERPRSAEEAISMLAGDAESRVLAGGQSLVPLLTLGFAEPDVLVSLDRCDELDDMTFGASAAAVGAMVTTRRIELDTTLAHRCPLLVAAAGKVGSPHVRNFGTLVGNLCHADPGSDLIPAALCLEVEVEARSSRGSRRLSVDELVAGPFVTSLAGDELAVAAHVPLHRDPWRHGYRKLALRAGDLAVATAAVLVNTHDGRIVEARLVVGGALRRAGRITPVEEALAGAPTADAAHVALEADWVADVADELLPDATVSRDYLDAMLPRFVAATVGDAAGRT